MSALTSSGSCMRDETRRAGLFRERPRIPEQRRFHRPPDDAPDDVEEEQPAEDALDGRPIGGVVGVEERTAAQEGDQPERRECGIEGEGAEKMSRCGLLIVRAGRLP